MAKKPTSTQQYKWNDQIIDSEHPIFDIVVLDDKGQIKEDVSQEEYDRVKLAKIQTLLDNEQITLIDSPEAQFGN